MSTLDSGVDNSHIHNHIESTGPIEYQKVGLDESSHTQDYYKYGQEYADCALEELKPVSQEEFNQSHLIHQQQQRLSTEEEDHHLKQEFGHHSQPHIHDHEDSSEYNTDVPSDQNQRDMMDQRIAHLPPQYDNELQHLHLMQERAYGNNTDLESITQSKPHLQMVQQQASHDEHFQVHAKSQAPMTHQQSELFKAHAALQKQQVMQIGPTQSSFEGYQTDMTCTSMPTTSKHEASRVETRTTMENHTTAINSATEDSMKQGIPSPQVQQAATHLLEYTEVFVWGEDRRGQLGIDSQLQQSGDNSSGVRRPSYISHPRSCSFNILIKQVSCGENHSAILTAQGHLYMMGSNMAGQLGVSTVGPPARLNDQLGQLSQDQIEELYTAGSPILVESLKGLKVEQVSCGANFTTAICRPNPVNGDLVSKAQVFAWGSNQAGQLGDREIDQTNVPLRIEAFDVLEEEIIQVSCGGSHTLFLTSDRDVISCGNNHYGQCGFDPEECAQTNTPFKVAAFDSVCIVQVSAGFEHSLFLSENGQVFASGSNVDLQLGLGGSGFEKTHTPVMVEALEQLKVVKVEAGHSSACFTESGHLFLWGRGVWGDNQFPQKILTISNRVVDVSLGREMGIAVDDNGLAWGWGPNQNGELGVGDTEPRVHPFPVLNLKGKLVTKAHCGHNFVICLGNNVSKEIPQVVQVTENVAQFSHLAPGQEQQKKKKGGKKRRANPDSKRRSMSRPHTSSNYSKFVNDQSHLLPLQRKPKAEQRRDHSFGASAANLNSRNSSVDRNTSAGAHAIRRQPRNISTRKVSQERTLANLQQKYGGSVTTTSSMQPHQTYQQPQAMQIVTSASHEKSRVTTEQSQRNPQNHVAYQVSNRVVRSPTSTTHASRPPVSDYESGKQTADIEQYLSKIKQLKSQLKNVKEENKAIKEESSAKNQVIQKLERQIQKQQNDEQKQIQELINDAKRSEMKLRKMKERRNHYRDEKDVLKDKVAEMQKDNELLYQQVSLMQEQSHSTREENASLKTKLVRTEKELNAIQEDMKQVKDHTKSLKGQNEQVEKELQGHIAWQESKVQDLTAQVRFESEQRTKMSEEIVRLERLVRQREDYVVSLENEAIYLRKEIKNAKFNNEKQGYNGFVSGLTKLRSSQERSRSSNRVTPGLNSSTIDNNTSFNLSNQNTVRPVKQDQFYDDLPQKDQNRESTRKVQNNNDQHLFGQQQEARTRLMQQAPIRDANEQYHRLSSTKRSSISPEACLSVPRQPIKVYHDTESDKKRQESAKRAVAQALEFQSRQNSATQDQQRRQQSVEESELNVSQQLRPVELTNQQSCSLDPVMAEDTTTQMMETISATVAGEDYKVQEEPILDIKSDVNHQSEPELQKKEDVLSDQAEPEKSNALADNSTVIVNQASAEPPAKPEAEVQSQNVASTSNFKDQSRDMVSQMQSPAPETNKKSEEGKFAERKLSTMIPLGAPKGEPDLRDAYKQMLMAKMDMKVIQKRRRLDRSQEQ